jgi:hypothetical protein
MTLQEANEIKTAPRPEYQIKELFNGKIYLWKSSAGRMMVEFRETSKDARYVLDDLPVPKEYLQYITTNDRGEVHYYELRFGPADWVSDRPTTYSLTGTGNPTEVFIGVLGAVEDFMTKNKDFCALEYSASGRGRVKSYNLLTRIMTDIHGLPYHIHNGGGTSAVYVVFFKDTVNTVPYGTAKKLSTASEDDDEPEKVYAITAETSAVARGDTRVTFQVAYELRWKYVDYYDDEDWEYEDHLVPVLSPLISFDRVDNTSALSHIVGTLEKFNVYNGSGVLVDYQGKLSIASAHKVARDQWPSAPEDIPFDQDNIHELLDEMFAPMDGYLDYIIIRGSQDQQNHIDAGVKSILSKYFNFETAPNFRNHDEGREYDIMNDTMIGHPCKIYYRLKYDYALPADRNVHRWASAPGQAYGDRQQELPYGL